MPEMSGHELAYEIRLIRPESPVLIFSGAEIPGEIRELVDAVVPKSDGHRRLLPILNQLWSLSRHRKSDQNLLRSGPILAKPH